MGIPRPMGGPPSSAPPQSGVSTTATSTASSVMLQPRVPGSPSSIRMSPTARQEYDAYMQSRLRMAAQSPRPRAPTTIQLGVSDRRCRLFYGELYRPQILSSWFGLFSLSCRFLMFGGDNFCTVLVLWATSVRGWLLGRRKSNAFALGVLLLLVCEMSWRRRLIT